MVVTSVDAVFAMNCLLRLPNHDVPAVVAAVRAVLRPGGLFFVGVCGGNQSADGPIWTSHPYRPAVTVQK